MYSTVTRQQHEDIPKSRPEKAAPEWKSVDLSGLKEMMLTMGKIEERIIQIDLEANRHRTAVLALLDAACSPKKKKNSDQAKPIVEHRKRHLNYRFRAEREQAQKDKTLEAILKANGDMAVAAHFLGIQSKSMYKRVVMAGISVEKRRAILDQYRSREKEASL